MGDSITDGWGRKYGKFFPGKPYLNRGISGQTTPQMLIRFRGLHELASLTPLLIAPAGASAFPIAGQGSDCILQVLDGGFVLRDLSPHFRDDIGLAYRHHAGILPLYCA